MRNKNKIKVGKKLFHENRGLVEVHSCEADNFDSGSVFVTLDGEPKNVLVVSLFLLKELTIEFNWTDTAIRKYYEYKKEAKCGVSDLVLLNAGKAMALHELLEMAGIHIDPLKEGK